MDQYLENKVVYSVIYLVHNGFNLIINSKAILYLKQKMIKPADKVCH